MNTQDLRKRWDDLRQVADEVRLQLHLATMEAKKYWAEEVEPSIQRIEQAFEDRVEQTADARHQLLEQLAVNVRRVRDEIQSRIGSQPPTAAS